MTPDLLCEEITRFLQSRQARNLCTRYGAKPIDVRGELYQRLWPRACLKKINDLTDWVRANGRGVLQNHLRSEYTTSRENSNEWRAKLTRQNCVRHEEVLDLDTVQCGEVVARVRAAIDLLTQKEHAALMAHGHLNGDSCRALARRWGVSKDAVCKLARVARVKLAAVLHHTEGSL